MMGPVPEDGLSQAGSQGMMFTLAPAAGYEPEEDCPMILPAPEGGGDQDEVNTDFRGIYTEDSLGVSESFATPSAARALHPAEERRLVDQEDQADTLVAGRDYYVICRKWHLEWLQWVRHHSVQSPKIGPSAAPPHNIRLEAIREDACTPPPSPAKSSSLSGSYSVQKFTKERPGPINNRNLLESEDTGALKRDLSEHQDYDILSEGVWNLLHGWYGGGPTIKRQAVAPSPFGRAVIQLCGLKLKVWKTEDRSEVPVEMVEWKYTKTEDFKRRACRELSLNYNKVRMWDYFKQKKHVNLENLLHNSLDENRIYEDNDILLEEQNADGTWPASDPTPFTSPYEIYHNDDVTTGHPAEKGAVGLQNLGNTCFMNSSLQCLSNVPELREYFLSEKYKENLNPDAFKTAGKLAEAYAKLVKSMWAPTSILVSPRNFKWQIGQFAEQFSGYGQQDSMEFIEYVLDGLKEDVNKVQGKKPFVELKEADGREDTVVAEEARSNYLQRNNSFIDELFLGFFKSTVTCPEAGCGRVSVTFDPFLSVKLSLVSASKEKLMTFAVRVVPFDGPVKVHQVTVSKFGNAEDLVEASANMAGLDPKRCVLAEVWNKKVYKFFGTNDAVERISPRDVLVVYELDDTTEFQMTPNEALVTTDHWYQSSSTASAPSQEENSANNDERVGVVIHHSKEASYYLMSVQYCALPLLMVHKKRTTGQQLIEAVTAELRKRVDTAAEADWKLYTDRQSMGHRKQVLPEDEILLEKRQYLNVEWPQPLDEAVETLSRMLEDTTSNTNRNRTPVMQLTRCLEMFTESDQLSEADTWYCNRCKEHRQAFKKMDFWSLPPVLILQLKRFVYTQYSRDRLDASVAFPLEGLDLRSYGQPGSPAAASEVYDLAALSKHIGSMGGGHYVAYARSSESGKWYSFNDGIVSMVDAERVEEEQVGAYVLFYLRRDRRPAGWGPPRDDAMQG